MMEMIGIKHILACIKHPQTNGKLDWPPREIRCKLHRFKVFSYGSAIKSSEPDHAGGQFGILPWKYTVSFEEGLAKTLVASCGRC